MATWEQLDWVEADCSTYSGSTKNEKILKTVLEVKLIGERPMYRAKLGNFDYTVITKITDSLKYNAKFTWKGTTYYLNVPYWD